MWKLKSFRLQVREKPVFEFAISYSQEIYDFLETNVHILFCWRSGKLSTVYGTCYA